MTGSHVQQASFEQLRGHYNTKKSNRLQCYRMSTMKTHPEFNEQFSCCWMQYKMSFTFNAPQISCRSIRSLFENLHLYVFSNTVL